MVSLQLPAHAEPRASILIAAFNPPEFGRCVRSLATRLSGEPSCEVIATLNGPSDALLEAAREVEGLRTVDTPVNLGLAAGANLARDAARGEFLVLFQDDAEIEPGWLEALVTAADANPDAGAVGGLVCWPGGERVQTAGVVLWSDCSHSEVGAGSRPGEWDGHEPFAVDYSPSSSLLVRAEAWDAIGGLDDAYFPAGHIDADLAMRIRRSGRAVLVEPKARTRHRRGASSTKPFKRFIAVRNAALFRERWSEELARTQEPRGECGAEALERALARAAERRHALAGARAGAHAAAAAPAGGRAPAPTPDPLAVANRHIRLHQAYEAELEPALEHFESETTLLRERATQLSARLEERERQLAEITGGGWWRLRERLLPVLGLAAALRRRFRRT
jgi:GT2 family glycosyltransferase